MHLKIVRNRFCKVNQSRLAAREKIMMSVIFILLLTVANSTSAQNLPLDSVKKGDYVYIEGKKFEVELKIKGPWYWRRIEQFFYVDQVYYSSDNAVETVELTDGKDIHFTIRMDDQYSSCQYFRDKGITITVCDTCRSDGKYMKYICNDSTAFFSTHPAKPFRYGEWVKKNEINTYLKQAEFFDFHSGDSVVSIGAASGWYEGAISVFTDSVDYLIQDIDPWLLTQTELNGVARHFSSLRDSPQTNTFNFVIGKTDDAGLPEGKKYDKILLNNCYHHFDKKWMMLHDLVSHLKDDGELILAGESFSNFYTTEYHGGCEIRALQAKDVIRFFATLGLYPVRMVMPMNSLDNVIVFSKNEMESKKRLEQLKPVDQMVFKIDRLHTSFYAGDTFYINSLENELKEFLPTLHSSYDSLDFYLIDIAYFWMDRDNYTNAIAVLNLGDGLYPDHGDIQFAFGEAHLWNEDEDLAITYFERAERLDPELKEDIIEVLKFWREWMGLPEVEEENLDE